MVSLFEVTRSEQLDSKDGEDGSLAHYFSEKLL